MLTTQAELPALSPAALRRFEVALYLSQAVLAGAVGWLLGPGGLLAAFAFVGAVLALHLLTGAALRRYARGRSLRFIPRRDWRAAWRLATYTASVEAILARSSLFGLAVVQVGVGQPAWALDPKGWAGVAVGAVGMALIGLWHRGSVATDAWAAANRETAPGP